MTGRASPSTLRAFVALSAPWLGRWRTRGAILLLLLLTASQVALAIAFNLWNARLFDALEQRNAAALLREVWIFALILLGIVLSNAAQLEAKRGIALAWRQALTERLLGAWLADGRHWRLSQLLDSPDNPDGRIAEDIRIATEHAVELASTLFFCSTTLIAFLGILWSLSGVVQVLGLPVPGHMVWLALLYAAMGAAAAFALGRPLTTATEARQRAEADFRFGMARNRDHAEALGLARGETTARAGLAQRFGALSVAWRQQSEALRNLTGFQSAYTTLAPILPILVSAPRYLGGQLSLGGLMQIAQGFQQTVVALSWPVDQAARLAEWHASADRVLALLDAIESAEAEPGSLRPDDRGAALALSGLILRHPDGSALCGPLDATLPLGSRVSVTGDAAAATALFLAIAGLWPWGEGRLVRPAMHALGALPRHPWLPDATLADLLTPPSGAPRAALAAALDVVGLGTLATRLDETADWAATLDEGDRLRLGFARLLLGRPDLVLMDDLPAVLGAEETKRLLGILTMAMPQAILLVADHGALDLPERLELVAPVNVPRGRAAQAAARRRASQFADWLRRGFGHAQE
ncbi:ABC transporter ATP-binding protein/permease [Falsiroseomonas oryzae]|uniref:ABC transporter ATP-binding protein/permease n=1 Tax=Falsiroseomonas oryzae TaxID=2766473 RepID=UPI0022EAEE5A|nr:SbmA/BacA-like family transporter [Roseomonas sp. MO-31]